MHTHQRISLQDERFNREIDLQTGYRTKALLCMPIKDSSGDVIGVAQVINKLNCERFTENDEKVRISFSFHPFDVAINSNFPSWCSHLQIFASYLQFCGIGLRNAQLYEKSLLEVKRNQVLLDLARMIFEEQSTIEHMVLRILTHMQSLIQCQRVQVKYKIHRSTMRFDGELWLDLCFCWIRFCWFMRHQRAVSREFLTSKLMTLVKRRIVHVPVLSNPDFLSTSELQVM